MKYAIKMPDGYYAGEGEHPVLTIHDAVHFAGKRWAEVQSRIIRDTLRVESKDMEIMPVEESMSRGTLRQ